MSPVHWELMQHFLATFHAVITTAMGKIWLGEESNFCCAIHCSWCWGETGNIRLFYFLRKDTWDHLKQTSNDLVCIGHIVGLEKDPRFPGMSTFAERSTACFGGDVAGLG